MNVSPLFLRQRQKSKKPKDGYRRDGHESRSLAVECHAYACADHRGPGISGRPTSVDMSAFRRRQRSAR